MFEEQLINKVSFFILLVFSLSALFSYITLVFNFLRLRQGVRLLKMESKLCSHGGSLVLLQNNPTQDHLPCLVFIKSVIFTYDSKMELKKVCLWL